MQTKLASEVGDRQGAGQILLVRDDEKSCVLALLSIQNLPELVLGEVEPVMVAGVDHEYNAVVAFVVVAPEHADFVLATDIPDGHGELSELNLFHVESDGRDGGGDHVEFKVLQDGSLAGGVEADHEHLAFLLEACEQVSEFREEASHRFELFLLNQAALKTLSRRILVGQLNKLIITIHHLRRM